MAGMWMADPDAAGMQRYWDGSGWTQLRRRTDVESVVERQASPRGGSLDVPDRPGRDFVAEARLKVAADLELGRVKAIEQPTICVNGGCDQPRVEGFYQCAAHQETLRAHGYTPTPVSKLPAQKGTRRARTCQAWECHAPKVEGDVYCAKHTAGGTGAPVAAQVAPSGPRGSAALLCPHCGERGQITSKPVKVKRGISGGKATGALLTGGISLLGTGLSRKEHHVERWCHNCGSSWLV